jgi:uncharacterized membrane protein YgdD (TMEM256/DUF423 family)
MRSQVFAAAVCGLLLVASGAIGAHAVPADLSGRLDGALLFGFVHTLAALAAALLPLPGRLRLASGWMFLAGVVLFSGMQIARLLSQADGPSPFDALGMLVPVGGIAFMVGWGLLGLAALLAGRPESRP